MKEKSASGRTLWLTWVALIVLLALTRAAAGIHLGVGNTIIAMLIAGAKMLLVILFFMQVRYSSRLIWVFACAGFIWWTIFISLAMTDYVTRQPVTPYNQSSPVIAGPGRT